LKDPVYQGDYSLPDRIGIVARLLIKGILPGGLPRLRRFLRSLPLSSPAKMPQAIVDWIAGLAMRDYVIRRFGIATQAQRERFAARVVRLRGAVRAYIENGAAAVSFEHVAAAVPRLSVSLRGGLDRVFFARVGRHVERLMRRGMARLTLRVSALHEGEARHLHRLLRRLARYGDRISIQLHERVFDIVRVDSSVFHVVFVAVADAA